MFWSFNFFRNYVITFLFQRIFLGLFDYLLQVYLIYQEHELSLLISINHWLIVFPLLMYLFETMIVLLEKNFNDFNFFSFLLRLHNFNA